MNPSSGHIPQPPHTAGKRYDGLRSRIDPEQIPSPVEVSADDQAEWNGKMFMTLPGEHVPMSTTDYIAFDQGNSTPRFIRPTMWHMPNGYDLADACQIPMAAIIQPFAELHAGEDDTPLVQTDDTGPARCERCRGYINPWCTFVAGGIRWKCNLCKHESAVLPEYFCYLDANLMRTDLHERPELNKGTVDFFVPSSYHAEQPPPRITPSYYDPDPPKPSSSRAPEPMRFLFVINVSSDAIATGLVQAACIAIKSVLFGGETSDGTRLEPCFPNGCTVGIITYDSALHFYDLSPGRDSAGMLVVPDIEEEMISPLRHRAFVDPFASRNIIENLLDTIVQRFSASPEPTCALGAALRGCLASLANWGGHAILFHSSQCNNGPGIRSQFHDESSLYDTEKEKLLFSPREGFWRDIGEECAEAGIGVSMFIGTGQRSFADIASVGIVSNLTGGQIFYHPRFDPPRDSPVLCSQLAGLVSRRSGYNAIARVRVSSGLRVRSYLGALHERISSDIDFGVIHADSTFSVTFEHAHRTTLDERENVFIQCAVLYTSVDGRRRVRLINLALEVAALAGTVFKFADIDATVCHLAKEAMTSLSSHTLSNIRDTLTEKCSCILLAYRRNCAAATSPSQLILPESFKLLLIYTLALHKHKSLKAHNVPADVRNYYAHLLLSMPVRKTLYHLYPRFMSLHNMPPDVAVWPEPEATVGEVDSAEPIFRLPPLLRDTYTGMQAHGLYLADNEDVMIMWVGSLATPALLQDVFGVDSIHQIDIRSPHVLPRLPTVISTQIWNILTSRKLERGGTEVKLYIARQNMDAMEIEFGDMLVEDQNGGAMSYMDYLCFVHKQINAALTGNTSLGNTTSYGLRGSPW